PQHFGHGAAESAVEYTYHLTFDIGGIGHGAEHIENGAQPQLLARAYGKTHGAVMCRCEHKAHAHFFHTASHLLRRAIEFDTRRFKYICTAHRAGYGSVAVFGYAPTSGGHHESTGGRDIEQVGAIASGTAGVHQI